jgi:hypothetical protein
MEIVSECRASRLTIEVVGSELVHNPTLNLSVTVVDEGFCGAYDGIWVGMDEYESFVAALRDCEQTRLGKAALDSFSPGELILVIENDDGWGHFRLRYTLGKMSYKSRVPLTKAVTGGFDLDSERLAQHVSDFQSLRPLSEERRSP